MSDIDGNDPVTVKEALTGPESTQWKALMQNEYQSFLENK